MASILVLHGPNLNMLGKREQDLYGNVGLNEINQRLQNLGQKLGHTVSCVQSNAEHELIDKIQGARTQGNHFIIINPGAFTHTSIALRDALLGSAIPLIEVHISNIYRREPFRAHSYFSDIAEGVISGLGTEGYEFALHAANDYLNRQNSV